MYIYIFCVTSTPVYMYIYMNIYIYMLIHKYVYVHMYKYVYIYVYMCMYRDVNAMQKKCSRDIEVARTEERRVLTKEIEKIRIYFLDRECQTNRDLSQLEASHSDRVKRLEIQLNSFKKKVYICLYKYIYIHINIYIYIYIHICIYIFIYIYIYIHT
jgi:hypothetical protein